MKHKWVDVLGVKYKRKYVQFYQGDASLIAIECMYLTCFEQSMVEILN